MGWANPGAVPVSGAGTGYMRVLVTDVVKVGDAVRVKAQLDDMNPSGTAVRYKDAFELLLARKGDRVTAVMNVPYPYIRPASLGVSNGMPCFLLGYPGMAELPRDKAAEPQVAARKLGALAVRYTPSYDGKAGLVKVNVSYFRNAREGDREKGKEILYVAPEPDRLLSSAPMGVQAGPLFTAVGDYPRQQYGDADKYKVWPVTVQESEEQEWEPGAPFPKRIVRYNENGRCLFDLTLVRTEKVPLEPAPAESATPATAAPAGK